MRPDAALSRRGIIGAAGASVLAGCTATTAATRPARGAAACLPRPKVSDDRLIRSLVGLRPYRPSGFVVRAEQLGPKRLVHNYGHGGSGITLSWGTSRLATNLGLQGHQGPVAVIGAGVVGLTTARLVQEAGYPVTIYARALPPETTSNIAGGQWYPSLLYDFDTVTPAFARQLVAAASYAYRRYQIMVGEEYGIRWMTNYELSDHPFGQSKTDRLMASMLPESRALRPDEHGFDSPYVRQFKGMLIEPPRFLRAMLRDVRIAGGNVVVRGFSTPGDVATLPEKLVFNCTGLGAKRLFGDEEMQPMRGQLAVMLPQPEVDYALETSRGMYMFSRSDGMILGGTADLGDWSLEPNPETTRTIIREHRRIASRAGCG
ncbi:FAD-dependent oxidoreductase [Stakelama saccharophila]|uniref:D-amino-acid oxidase n=1 Tax=Stakelama saccharophila TaxID=3075605 RepID=A0ABZ0B7I8_9SPHN|nr:FAD-dependent oxidoreductase [Stakelama sp. W311]WNO53250.1 FAD-dependent oxidoreductase [Stakelama sp. W311]